MRQQSKPAFICAPPFSSWSTHPPGHSRCSHSSRNPRRPRASASSPAPSHEQSCERIFASPTPLTPITFRNRTVFIKRDDLLEFHGVTGSKLRKFYSLLLDDSLRDSTHIVSYGGAQSNAMYALARLASFRGKKFVYFTRRTSSRLQSTPGNLKSALDVGMIHVQLDNDDFRHIFTDTAPAEIEPIIQTLLQEHSISAVQSSIVFIPQGGAWCGAEPGVSILAQELRTQLTHLRQHGLLAPKKPILFMPSGTGTTAFYLQKHVQDILSVVTVPISGDEKYLVKQMRWLEASHARDNHVLRSTVFPGILRPRLRASFADVRIEKLLIWKELSRSTNNEFEFDLIYAPKTWEEVMLAIEEGRIASNGEDLLYYHTGGIEGNVSMLDRFKREGVLT